MKWFKWITIVLLLAIVGISIYQNLATFDAPSKFGLDLHFQEFSWSPHLYTIIGIAALLGFILGILLMLKPHVKTRRLLAAERQEKQQLREKQQGQETPRTTEKPQAPQESQEPSVPGGQAVSGNPGSDAAASAEPHTQPTESS
jgi:uncharacterized membrane protein YciS (DUF1049 family)